MSDAVATVGLAIQVILFIPPFIAALGGVAPRFAFTYTAILTAFLAFLFAISFIYDCQNGYGNRYGFRNGYGSLTERIVSDIFMLTAEALFELIMSLIAYYCGRALRALTLRPLRHFGRLMRAHRATPPSAIGPTATLVDILRPHVSMSAP